MQTGITVLVIDRHPIIGWALREYLSRHGQIAVLGIFVSTHEALATIKQKKPDVVIMGTSQPDITCLEAVSNVVNLGTQVVAFCDVSKKEQIEAFIAAGGIGFVPKSSPLDDLKKAIESAANGKKWVAPALQAFLSIDQDQKETGVLTNREREIVALVAQGLSSKMIADKLFISVNTVESHRKRIFKKLNIHNCTELVRYAVNEGLILELK